MSGNHTAVTQGVTQQFKKGLLEQRLGRTLGVGRVGDDHIELVLAVLEELEAIANVHADVGVLEADGHAGEVFLGDADDGLTLSTQHTYTYNMI